MKRFTKKAGKHYECDKIVCKAIDKLGELEDIEERLSKFEEVGISGLVDLFSNLTDEDIEYVVQLAFKKRERIFEI